MQLGQQLPTAQEVVVWMALNVCMHATRKLVLVRGIVLNCSVVSGHYDKIVCMAVMMCRCMYSCVHEGMDVCIFFEQFVQVQAKWLFAQLI